MKSVGLGLKPVNKVLKLWNLGVLGSIGNQGVASRPQIASVRQSYSEAKDLEFGLDSCIPEPFVGGERSVSMGNLSGINVRANLQLQ